MPDPAYLAAALAVAVGITVTLRAAPFGMKHATKGSALLADIGRWMPLGAIIILAVYCLTTIDVTAPPYGVSELVGVAVTLAVHLWRRSAVVSIVTGTAACLAMTNWVLPA